MKTIVAILLLAMPGAAMAEPANQPLTVYKDGKPYIDDRLEMRRRLPSGYRSDARQAPAEATEDKPITVYKDGKPYIYDGNRQQYRDDRMRRLQEQPGSKTEKKDRALDIG